MLVTRQEALIVSDCHKASVTDPDTGGAKVLIVKVELIELLGTTAERTELEEDGKLHGEEYIMQLYSCTCQKLPGHGY